MTTDSQPFLTALRLADSFLPVGGYTASYGLEQYCNEGRIETPEELRAVIAGYLERLVGPCELVALANAHAASAEGDLEAVLAVDERLHAVTMAREFRESSTRAGRRLLDVALLEGEPETERRDGGSGTPAVEEPGSHGVAGAGTPTVSETDGDVALRYAESVHDGETTGHYPVALGVVTERNGLSRAEACHVHAYSFVTDLLGAAQRLGRFGHTEIQSALSELLPAVATVCDRHVDDELESMASFAPLAEIMGMRHERADRRLFVS